MSVEASIVVPVAFLVLLPFLFLIRSVYIYDSVQSATAESAQLLAGLYYLQEKIPEDAGESGEDEGLETAVAEGSLSDYRSLVSLIRDKTGLPGAKALLKNLSMQVVLRYLNDQLLKEKKLENMGLTHGTAGISYLLSDFHYEENEYHDLIRIHAAFPLAFPFVSSFASLGPRQVAYVVRKFVGQEARGTGSEEGPGSDETEEPIYYRLSNGYHYHTADCYMLDKDKRTMPIQQAYEEGYSACSYCHPQNETQVIVTSGGKSFHAAGCYRIGESVTPVTMSEIIAEGYLPCQICIGGGEWFG